MKVKLIPAIISLMISALIAYALYGLCKVEVEGTRWLLTILGGISVFVTLGLTVAVKFEDTRRSINIKTIGGIFTVLLIACNLIFALINFKIPTYIIVVGLLLSLFLLIVYSIHDAKQ